LTFCPSAFNAKAAAESDKAQASNASQFENIQLQDLKLKMGSKLLVWLHF
jgi:hypothetical protein